MFLSLTINLIKNISTKLIERLDIVIKTTLCSLLADAHLDGFAPAFTLSVS